MPSCTRGLTPLLRALFVVHACAAFALPARARADEASLPTTLPEDDAQPPDAGNGPPIRFEGSLTPVLSVPLANNPDVVGFGFAVTYGVAWGEIPLALGLDFMSIGSVGDADDRLDLMLGDESVTADRITHSRILHFEAWLRLQPAHWRVRPYLEGFFGTQQFQAKYELRVSAQNLQSDLVNGSDWVHSYGWGLGVELVGVLNRSGSMSLTLGARRVYGGTAELTRPTTIADQIVDTHLRAGTSALLFMIGVGGHYELSDPPQDQDFLGD
jgi:hypothetical protein